VFVVVVVIVVVNEREKETKETTTKTKDDDESKNICCGKCKHLFYIYNSLLNSCFVNTRQQRFAIDDGVFN